MSKERNAIDILEQALEDLELYKKALEIALYRLQQEQHLKGGLYGYTKETFEIEVLRQARKELNNGNK